MSSCDVCLSGYDGDVEFFYSRARRARKEYECAECNSKIRVGEQYVRVGGKCEGAIWESIACECCFEINETFSCGGGTIWGAGTFWDDMHDVVFPELRVSSPCFNKLSIAARAKVTEQWWQWKERNA